MSGLARSSNTSDIALAVPSDAARWLPQRNPEREGSPCQRQGAVDAQTTGSLVYSDGLGSNLLMFASSLERNGSMLRSRPDLDRQAEVFEASNETFGDMGFVSTLEVVGTEFVVRDFVFQNVVCRGQDGGGHGENGLLRSTPTFEAEKLRA